MIHFRQIGRSDLSCEWWVGTCVNDVLDNVRE